MGLKGKEVPEEEERQKNGFNVKGMRSHFILKSSDKASIQSIGGFP